MSRTDLRAGAMAIVPMLIGVIPFGPVAGVTPVAEGLGTGAAVGFSTVVFAGAAQLAAIDVLGDGEARGALTCFAIPTALRSCPRCGPRSPLLLPIRGSNSMSPGYRCMSRI